MHCANVLKFDSLVHQGSAKAASWSKLKAAVEISCNFHMTGRAAIRSQKKLSLYQNVQYFVNFITTKYSLPSAIVLR